MATSLSDHCYWIDLPLIINMTIVSCFLLCCTESAEYSEDAYSENEDVESEISDDIRDATGRDATQSVVESEIYSVQEDEDSASIADEATSASYSAVSSEVQQRRRPATKAASGMLATALHFATCHAAHLQF